MRRVLSLCLLFSAALASAQIPPPTELPSHPYSIKKTWFIGGTGNWDYLTMDPKADRLFIAHGPAVQVIDVETGTLVGTIGGLKEAHEIALDDSGQFGYVTDGLASKVVVFDRGTLQTVATIATDPNPRSLVLEPGSGLLFAIASGNAANNAIAASRNTRSQGKRPPVNAAVVQSVITVIDTQARAVIGTILFPTALGFAMADGKGQVYVCVTGNHQIFHFDAQAVAGLLHDRAADSPNAAPGTIDWFGITRPPVENERLVHSFMLDVCTSPQALALDGAHDRLFAACDNMKLAVINTDTGQQITTLPIGPGADAVGYDPEHNTIYSANGGAQGSVTVIQQDVTDTYAVTQILPTRQRARTLAVNPQDGAIYLVTDYVGVDLAQPGGIGALKTKPVEGSFQVLQVGN